MGGADVFKQAPALAEECNDLRRVELLPAGGSDVIAQ